MNGWATSVDVIEAGEDGTFDITPPEGFDYANTVIEVAELDDGRALVAHRPREES